MTDVHAVDPQRLNEVQNVKRSGEYPVTYIDCPVCRKLMNRVNLGTRSGVIADQCRQHGMWLDGGELRQIMEWMKAGGGILQKEKELEMARLELEQEKKKLQFARIDMAFAHSRPDADPGSDGKEVTLLPLLGRLLQKIFR